MGLAGGTSARAGTFGAGAEASKKFEAFVQLAEVGGSSDGGGTVCKVRHVQSTKRDNMKCMLGTKGRLEALNESLDMMQCPVEALGNPKRRWREKLQAKLLVNSSLAGFKSWEEKTFYK